MTPAVLAQDLQTPHGLFSAGTTVAVLGRRARTNRWNVCLDPSGVHLSRRCHVATVTEAWLTAHPEPAAQRATVEQERELLSATRQCYRHFPARSAA